MNNDWQLKETGFSGTANRAWEGLFTQGSGYLHARGSLEEHFTDSPQNATYLRMPVNVTAEKFPATQAKWGDLYAGGATITFDKTNTASSAMHSRGEYW